jgi:hypothetical protein
MKPTKHFGEGGRRRRGMEYDGGGELIQSTLYTYIELSQ